MIPWSLERALDECEPEEREHGPGWPLADPQCSPDACDDLPEDAESVPISEAA